MKAVWSGEARKDLTDIRRFSVKRWGRDVAKRYLADLQDAARTIADNPDRTKPFRGPYRLFRVRSHVLVSRNDDDNDRIVIVRVLHSAMDVIRHLPPDESEKAP